MSTLNKYLESRRWCRYTYTETKKLILALSISCYGGFHMKNQDGYYKQSIPKLSLSIERGTSKVPNDGKFHLLQDNKVIESFRLMKNAEERFRQLVSASGYKPEIPTTEKTSVDEDGVERYMNSKAIFWAEGPISRTKGGRGGRGGV